MSSATSFGAWSAVATFPKIRVKTSSGSDSFYDESFSDETLLFRALGRQFQGFSLPLQEWINACMRNGDWFMLKGTNWQSFFMGALAMIWLWHNKWIHDENFVAPMDLVTI